MMRFLSLLLLFALSAPLLANVPPPEEPPEPPRPVTRSTKVAVTIRQEALGDKDVKAKIVIPRSLLPGEPKPAGTAPQQQGAAPRPVGGTILAGIAFSLAAVSVVWLRRGKPGQRPLLMLLVGGLLLAGAIGALYADIAVPGRRPNRRLPEPQPPPVAKEVILLEIVDEGDTVVLTLPK